MAEVGKHGPLRFTILIACFCAGLHAQDSASTVAPPAPPVAPPPAPPVLLAAPVPVVPVPVIPAPVVPAPEPKRLFGLLPNNHTTKETDEYTPLTPKEKFKLTNADVFDRSTFIDAAIFGGMGQWHRDNPSFGNGVPAYAHYFATSATDFMVGDYMTEAVLPILLHQDPRFFRRGTGTFFSRLRPAVMQIFWTRMDSGRMRPNYSEVGGNAMAVAISQAYYPDNRNARTAATNMAVQIGVDMAGNVIKEFAPELRRTFLPWSHAKAPGDP